MNSTAVTEIPSPFGYKANVTVNAILSIAMTGTTIYGAYLLGRSKSWFFVVFIIGGFFESLGYITRTIAAGDYKNDTAFLIQFFAIILAPSFLAAGLYVAFGRLVWFTTPSEKLNFKTLWVPPRWITPIFVVFDVLSFLIQVAGVGSVAGSLPDSNHVPTPEENKEMSDAADNGKKILKIGLGVQLLCFGLFALVAARFLVASKRWVLAPHNFSGNIASTRWRHLSWALNGAATVIMLRAIYRVFEFTGGSEDGSYIQLHEWTFWVCDSLPIVACLVVFCVIHPSKYIPESFRGLRLNKKMVMKSKLTPPTYTMAPFDTPGAA